MRAFEIAFVFLLAACGSPVLQSDLERVVLLASDALNYSFGREVVGAGGILVTIGVRTLDHGDGKTSFYSDHEEISISNAIGNEGLAALVLHEMGHALGLQHSPDRENVMFRTVPQVDLNEAATQISRLCARQGCAPKISPFVVTP